MATKETKITRFHGGKVEDLRTQSSIASSLIQHFDTHNEHKLTPYRSFEADESHSGGVETTAEMAIARVVYVNGNLFGYGQISDVDTKVKIYEKNGDLLTSGWVGSSGGAASGGGARDTSIFFAYKNDIYGINNDGVWSYETDNNTLNEADVSNIGSGHSTFAEPVHHPADDIAYFFADNEVHKNDAGSWSGAGGTLTLPSDSEIVSAAPYGNYLIIGTRPNDNYGQNSVLYFWNRDGSLSTVSEKVYFTGRLQHVANLQGDLIAIDTSFDGTGDTDVVYLNIRNGRTGRVIKSYRCQSASFSVNKFVEDDILYFVMRFVDVNGEVQQGIWAVKSDGTLTLDQVPSGVTQTDTSPPRSYNGIYKTAQTWWINHDGPNDGTEDFSIDRTVNPEAFNETSVYESVIFTGGDSGQTKKLIGVRVTHEALPTDGQVVVKFRTDEDIRDGNAFTTLTTNTTDDSMRTEAVRDSSGNRLPRYKELQIRIESTGGAEITSLKFVYEEIDDGLL